MAIAGFDVATRTGICVMNADGSVAHVESWRAPVMRPDHLGPQDACPLHESEIGERFRSHVAEVLQRFRVEHLAFEEPRTRDFERTKARIVGGSVVRQKERASGNLAMLRSFGLCTHLCGVARRLGISAVAVPADTWRKAFLGYSRAPKGCPDGRKYLKQAVLTQCRLLRIGAANDDSADAAGVCWWLSGHLAQSRRMRPGELFAEAVF